MGTSLMTAREAAAYLGCSYVIFQSLRDRGEIVPLIMGDGTHRYHKKNLDKVAAKMHKSN